MASTFKNHLSMPNFESDDGSSSNELDINPRNKQSVNIDQNHITSQSIEDHVSDISNTEREHSNVEGENINDGVINEEIENERKENEAREVLTRDIISDSEDSNSSKETKDDESDEASDDIAELRQWAIQSCIQHCHLDSLLRILRRRLIPNLPATSKTFLKTESANYQIRKFRSNNGMIIGEFIYFGIAAGLLKCVNKKVHLRNILDLQINCDGLPLYKSSAKQFWPILCKVHNTPDIYEPFPVAVFSGDEKPNNLSSYLSDFIKEMNKLTREGIIIEEQLFKVRIMCFVCDRPARSFLKCHKRPWRIKRM